MASKRKASKKSKKSPASRSKVDAAARGAARKPAKAEKAKAAAARPKKRVQPESLRLRSLSASLTSNDIGRSLRFYRDGLGFVVKDEWKENGKLVGYLLRAGSCEIGIGQDDWAKGRSRVKGVGFRLYCETTQDVDAFAARVRGAGFALAEEPTDHSWGVRAFTVDDPDGFRVSIFRKLKK
ncbi:MAG: VOC family protein [Candidatus Eisenbacteria bacterium]